MPIHIKKQREHGRACVERYEHGILTRNLQMQINDKTLKRNSLYYLI